MTEAAPRRAPWWRRRIRAAWLGRLACAAWPACDLLLPKRGDQWAFFTHPVKRGQFVENARAVFEQVKRDPSIRKRVFTRGGEPALGLEDAVATEVVELGSLAGLWALARCGVLLLTNSVPLDLRLEWDGGRHGHPRPALRRRTVVNLWHGIPLKALFALANPGQRRHGDRDPHRRRERRHYRGLVASSDADRHAMAAIFHPIHPDRVWATGLPRNDFLLAPEDGLPAPMRAELARVRALRRGRRLVLYAPTYRDSTAGDGRCYEFSHAEAARLRAVLQRHGAVMGVRMHYLRRDGEAPFGLERHLDGELLVDAGHAVAGELAPVLREASVVVTDYSSVYIDALYRDLPVLGFAWDLDDYRTRQNGLLYDLALAFPGPVATGFDAFLNALDRQLAARDWAPDAAYRTVQRLFFNRRDTGNARRVVERIRGALDGGPE